jgi:hypothetical protein
MLPSISSANTAKSLLQQSDVSYGAYDISLESYMPHNHQSTTTCLIHAMKQVLEAMKDSPTSLDAEQLFAFLQRCALRGAVAQIRDSRSYRAFSYAFAQLVAATLIMCVAHASEPDLVHRICNLASSVLLADEVVGASVAFTELLSITDAIVSFATDDLENLSGNKVTTLSCIIKRLFDILRPMCIVGTPILHTGCISALLILLFDVDQFRQAHPQFVHAVIDTTVIDNLVLMPVAAKTAARVTTALEVKGLASKRSVQELEAALPKQRVHVITKLMPLVTHSYQLHGTDVKDVILGTNDDGHADGNSDGHGSQDSSDSSDSDSDSDSEEDNADGNNHEAGAAASDRLFFIDGMGDAPPANQLSVENADVDVDVEMNEVQHSSSEDEDADSDADNLSTQLAGDLAATVSEFSEAQQDAKREIAYAAGEVPKRKASSDADVRPRRSTRRRHASHAFDSSSDDDHEHSGSTRATTPKPRRTTRAHAPKTTAQGPSTAAPATRRRVRRRK